MVIHQSYRIIRKLGQGGMGAVYLAQHTLMNEPQALKFLSSELSHDEAFTARFLREVRTLRQIRHKNVVDAGNLEPAEDGTLFFSMEYVDGPDLRAFLRDPQSHSAEDHAALKGHDFSRAANDPKEAPALAAEGSFSSISPISPNFSASSAGSLPVPLALSITRQIAEGLAAAHSRGMVHRDIKPENILLARDADAWLPKIADFGIVATKESSTAYTRTGGTLLTMAYAAPEQWRGTPAASLDGRTDLYALGGLLYEMLTGQTPFHAENYEGWSRQHQTTPPQPPSTLRPDLANWQGLDALVLRLLAKDCNDRPKDVAELVALLDAMRLIPSEVHRETVREVKAANVIQASAENSPNPAILSRSWWAAAVVSMLLIAIIVFELSRSKPSNEPTPTIPPPPSGTLVTSPPTERPQIDPATGERIEKKPWEQYIDIAGTEKNAEALFKQKHYSDARPLFETACNGGEMRACSYLGYLCAKGLGGERDLQKARVVYAEACDQGTLSSCASLGTLYQDAGNSEGAIKYFQKACNGGVDEACELLRGVK